MGEATKGIGPIGLVPLHTPRPLRFPLRELGFGCLRTRAISNPRPAGMVVRLRGGIADFGKKL